MDGVERPAFLLDADHPASDLASEKAAALAAASMIFKESDPEYSSECLRHAEELFTFADTYRGKYSDWVPANPFYT